MAPRGRPFRSAQPLAAVAFVAFLAAAFSASLRRPYTLTWFDSEPRSPLPPIRCQDVRTVLVPISGNARRVAFGPLAFALRMTTSRRTGAILAARGQLPIRRHRSGPGDYLVHLGHLERDRQRYDLDLSEQTRTLLDGYAPG